MMLKKFRCLVLAMVLVLVVVSCTTFAAVKPIKIIYGHVWAADHYYLKGDQYFKKLVEKNSKGQILVDIFPGSQLGGAAEGLQATRNGAQQMTQSGLGGFISRLVPKLAVFEMPYMYRDDRHVNKVIDRFNDLIDPQELAAKTGVRVIGIKTSTPRHMTSKVAVNKVEDLKGIKIRVGEVASMIAYWKSLGAVPTAIPTADVYTALATGTIDAVENSFSGMYAFKWYEQQKYCAQIGYMRGFYAMIINNNFWKKLTKKQQKILADAGKKCTKLMIKANEENDKEYYQLLSKAGMKFTKPDTTPFREKAKTNWSQFGDEKLIKKIQAIK
jgi:tripartite ATP-independent transporter DctP family solute receptor